MNISSTIIGLWHITLTHVIWSAINIFNFIYLRTCSLAATSKQPIANREQVWRSNFNLIVLYYNEIWSSHIVAATKNTKFSNLHTFPVVVKIYVLVVPSSFMYNFILLNLSLSWLCMKYLPVDVEQQTITQPIKLGHCDLILP